MILFSLAGEAALAGDRCGKADWFADSDGLTASGERNDAGALTAAHRSLPFGTEVKVENLANGRSVVVRVNDRGPKNRVISVSSAAADSLRMKKHGIVNVRLTVLGEDNPADDACDAAAHADAGGDLPQGDLASEESAPAPEAIPIPVASPIGGPFVALDVAPDDPDMAERFDLAFAPESWRDVELRRVMEAVAPRLFARHHLEAPSAPIEISPAPAPIEISPAPLDVTPAVEASPAVIETAPAEEEDWGLLVELPNAGTSPVVRTAPVAETSPIAVEAAAAPAAVETPPPVEAATSIIEATPAPVEPVPYELLFSQRLAEHWPVLQGQTEMDLSPAALSEPEARP